MIVGLLSWYAEDPTWLHECVSSLNKAGVDHLVAIDGGYAHFPKAKRRSSKDEHEAIRTAADESGIGLILKTPPKPWERETAKRNYLFRCGERITSESDWYLVIDGDEVIQEADLSELDDTHHIVATGTLIEPHPVLPTTRSPMRRLYKALRGIHLRIAHDTYFLPDGRILWGHENRVASLDLQDKFSMLHRTHFREASRKKAAKDFYADRDARREEAHPCGICGAPSVATAAYDWHRIDEVGRPGQRGRLSSKSMWACARHKEQLDRDAREILLTLGFDPTGLRPERQNV